MFTSCESRDDVPVAVAPVLLGSAATRRTPHAPGPLLRALPEIPSRRPSINCQFTHKSG